MPARATALELYFGATSGDGLRFRRRRRDVVRRGDAPAARAFGLRRRRLTGRMPLQNRVTPLSELVADPARGLVYGNRGCLHDAGGTDPETLRGKRWIACRLRVPGLASRAADAAGPLHRALLPRRGDRLRRRPSALRALPPRGLRPLRALWRELAPGRPRRRRDRRAAARRAPGPAARAQRHHEPASRSSRTGRSSSARASRGWCCGGSCWHGAPPATAPTPAHALQRRR